MIRRGTCPFVSVRVVGSRRAVNDTGDEADWRGADYCVCTAAGSRPCHSACRTGRRGSQGTSRGTESLLALVVEATRTTLSTGKEGGCAACMRPRASRCLTGEQRVRKGQRSCARRSGWFLRLYVVLFPFLEILLPSPPSRVSFEAREGDEIERVLMEDMLQIDADVDVEEVFVRGDMDVNGSPDLVSSPQMRFRPTQPNPQQPSSLFGIAPLEQVGGLEIIVQGTTPQALLTSPRTPVHISAGAIRIH